MKKLILTLLVSAAAFTSFAMQATVVSAKGKAEVQNGTNWIALKEGDSLSQGSVIQTGFKSEVVLKIKESTVTVAPLSRITLQALLEKEGVNGGSGKDETTIFLDTGSLKSNVQKSEDRRVGFTVRSPVATASVRGTEFDMKKTYRAVKLVATRGKVAFWKNTAKTEADLDSSEGALAEESGEGTEGAEGGEGAEGASEAAAAAPASGGEYTPPNAVFVGKGETANVAKGGGMTSHAQYAQAKAVSVGAGTQSAAGAERSSSFGGAPAGIAGPGSDNRPSSGGSGIPAPSGITERKTGRLSVNVKISSK